MSIACVLITHLPAKVELRSRPDLRGKPLILVTNSGRAGTVVDATPGVKGASKGMPIQEALSSCRGRAILLEADLQHYQRCFDGIIESLLKRSPMVERGELGCAYVDIHGCEPMYGGDAGVASGLLSAIPHEFKPRVGLAKTKFPAYVAAISSDPGQATKVPSDTSRFMQSFPISLLPVSEDTKTRLYGFGLHTMGQVASLTVGSLQSQFGTEGKMAWEMSNGIDSSIFTPERCEESVSEHLTFQVPATTLETIYPALEMLLGKALAHPIVRGRHIRSVSIRSAILNRAHWSKKFVFKTPINTREKAMFALKSSFDTESLPGPIEDITLTVSGITGEFGKQPGLFADARRHEQLQETMKHLEARLRREPPIYNVVEVQPWSRLPENRMALIQFSA